MVSWISLRPQCTSSSKYARRLAATSRDGGNGRIFITTLMPLRDVARHTRVSPDPVAISSVSFHLPATRGCGLLGIPERAPSHRHCDMVKSRCARDDQLYQCFSERGQHARYDFVIRIQTWMHDCATHGVN